MSPSDYPDDWRPTAADGPITLTVQGETFQVTIKPDGGCFVDMGPAILVRQG